MSSVGPKCGKELQHVVHPGAIYVAKYATVEREGIRVNVLVSLKEQGSESFLLAPEDVRDAVWAGLKSYALVLVMPLALLARYVLLFFRFRKWRLARASAKADS
jgi:hypothetical protein